MNYPDMQSSLSMLEKSSRLSISDRLAILHDLLFKEPSFCASIGIYFLDNLMKEAEENNLIIAKILIDQLFRQAKKRILECQNILSFNVSE